MIIYTKQTNIQNNAIRRKKKGRIFQGYGVKHTDFKSVDSFHG
jgi:hypothetical protein